MPDFMAAPPVRLHRKRRRAARGGFGLFPVKAVCPLVAERDRLGPGGVKPLATAGGNEGVPLASLLRLVHAAISLYFSRHSVASIPAKAGISAKKALDFHIQTVGPPPSRGRRFGCFTSSV